MHFHMELIMPPVQDIEADIEKILSPYNEHREDSRHGFYDWYQIGGRYSGRKIRAAVGEEAIDRFEAALQERKVTVSGLQWGKQELQPASQIPAVDALWQEMCPGGGLICPLFKHSGDHMQNDICRLDQMPGALNAYAALIACIDYDGEVSAENLYFKEVWNGLTHQETTWNGLVKDAVANHVERIRNYTEQARIRMTPQPDWLVVTIDYHS